MNNSYSENSHSHKSDKKVLNSHTQKPILIYVKKLCSKGKEK